MQYAEAVPSFAARFGDTPLLVRRLYNGEWRQISALEVENVFKIAAAYTNVREFLSRERWEFQGVDGEMDSFRNIVTGKRVRIEDISENFPVTFLMGGLGLAEFSHMARRLAPGVKLLEVNSRWEGKPTTIVVAMTEEQVRDMFGRRTRMRELPVHPVASH